MTFYTASIIHSEIEIVESRQHLVGSDPTKRGAVELCMNRINVRLLEVRSQEQRLRANADICARWLEDPANQPPPEVGQTWKGKNPNSPWAWAKPVAIYQEGDETWIVFRSHADAGISPPPPPCSMKLKHWFDTWRLT